MKNHYKSAQNVTNFVTHNSNAKSPLAKTIKYLTKETNKNKFTYDQLRYIFRIVRENCNINTSKPRKRLYELPQKLDLESFYNQISNTTHLLIFKTLQGTGLRVSELCNLEVNQINFDENTMFIKQGKGNKDRIVPFGNNLKEKLLIYLGSRNNRYLFESNRNSMFSTRRIEQICKGYLKKSKIETLITPHTFRHLYFTELASAKVPSEQRMIIAGHNNTKTQEVYTHLTLEGFKDDIIKILDK